MMMSKQTITEHLMSELMEYNPRIYQHCRRVQKLSLQIADQLKLDPCERSDLFDASLLHDIGKLYVPTEILDKSGTLDERELELLQQHAEFGYLILSMHTCYSGEVYKAVLYHHERYDGNGHFKKKDMNRISRIIAVADSLDTMEQGGPYCQPLEKKQIRRELIKRSGSQFDPVICEAARKIFF